LKDKRDVHVLTNTCNPPAEGNFCDENGNAHKPAVVEDYKTNGLCGHWRQNGKNYANSHCMWKWTKELFFHVLDLTVFNSYVLSSSCGKKTSHREFQIFLIRDMLAHAGREP
jgi:hypothetical protein